MEGPLAVAFGLASRFFAEAVGLVPAPAWQQGGLGDWDLLELVAHGNRAHTTLEEYLLRPRPPEPAGSSYFSDEAVAARGREAVAALGTDPVRAVVAASERAIALVERTPANATVGSPAGTMALGAYLPSRIAELTVHGLDVSRRPGPRTGCSASCPCGEPEVPDRAPGQEGRRTSGLASAVRPGAPTARAVCLLKLASRAHLPPAVCVLELASRAHLGSGLSAS